MTTPTVAGTKTIQQMAVELASEGECNLPKMPATRVPAAKPRRKKLPRTFDRRPKPWMQPVLDLPKHTGGEILTVRREVLGLSRADASRLLRVSRNTIWNWETSYRSAPFSAYALLRVLADQGRATGRGQQPAGISVPLALAARAARTETRRKSGRGELAPLGVNPETGKRPSGTGRYPTTGFLSPILKPDDSPPVRHEGRFRSRRERANLLRERMEAFSAIYNAGWLVRDAYFGSDQRLREKVMAFIAVLLQELRATQDFEACLFAVADALYASPSGVPWDG
jgi:transcriptional regulator with XRE-family HTH domain